MRVSREQLIKNLEQQQKNTERRLRELKAGDNFRPVAEQYVSFREDEKGTAFTPGTAEKMVTEAVRFMNWYSQSHPGFTFYLSKKYD